MLLKAKGGGNYESHWVTLCFAKTKVLNSSFKPNIGLKPN